MLKALQMSYSLTLFVVSFNNKYSNEFRTFSGIRQGATSSSALLLITFMDDLVKYLKATCESEDFLKDLHTLLHADGTVILSSYRSKFIDKCNSMTFFNSNRLSLNIGKSGYMVVSKKSVERKSIQLNSGILKYKESYNYLGYELTGSGGIRKDFKCHLNNHRSNTSTKFLNFSNLNFLASLQIKLKVLTACIKSTYLYSCEVWGNLNISHMQVDAVKQFVQFCLLENL